MPVVRFSHNRIPETLDISVGADQITWGYGLNTQTIPTYGGEVVQILSAYVDDLQITGTVKTYRKAEEIYGWFLKYIQVASQGDGPSFDETPITFQYPERGWHLKIKVHSLPGFRQATDLVAPTWQIQAAVVEGDPSMEELTRMAAENNKFDFNKLHGGIGYDDDNPFTNAFAGVTEDGKQKAGKDAYDPEQYKGQITDFFQGLLPAYLEGDFDSLTEGEVIGSKPTRNDEKKKGKQSDRDEEEEVATINSIVGGL